MKNKMDQEYSFALRPASIEEAGLFYSNDEQDEALGTVGHLRLDFGHGFLPLRSTCYPHNDDQFDTLEFKMLLREFLEAMQENGPLASLSSMEAYCQKHGGAITEDGQTYGYIWETERYRFCLRCTPSPFEYQGHLYCYDLWQQQIQKNCPVGQVTYASGEQQTFTVVQHYLQTIREELPYRDTTGFRFETLTDDPKVKTAVDDILLDFAGEENPRRACNYGLTEAGNQALRDAAAPDSPHTYAWFVLTDCNTLEEQIFRDLTLEEAIQIYQASDCQEKRIGVTKDEVATVDLVRSLDGEQQFFEDHRKLRSFQNDPFIASAVEKLKQELEQTVETQGFELSSPWTESDLQYQEYSQRMLSAISGLTSYAASLSAKGQDDTVGILRELLIDMCWIWEGYDPISETEMPWDEFLTQYMGPFDEAVEQARHTGNAPGIAPETKEQIFYGIGIHMRELTESCGNREQVRQWMSLAEQMNEEWAGTTQYPLFYQMINGPLWEGEMFKKPIIHLPYDMIPTSIVPKGWHYYHLYRDIKSIRIVDKCPEQGYIAALISPYSLKRPSDPFRMPRGKYLLYKEPITLCEFCEKYLVARRYFRKKDPAAQESNPEWIEMSGQEFYRFITSPAGRGCFFIDMEDVVIEAPKETYEEWRREQSRKNYRQNQAAKIGVKVLSLNSDEISERGSGVDVIPDETVHVEEDAILSSEIRDLYHTALKTLERTNWQVDYVITHCASTSIALSMNRHNEADPLTDFLEMIDRRLEYEYWFFGHFHDNRSVDQKHILLWEQIVQIL